MGEGAGHSGGLRTIDVEVSRQQQQATLRRVVHKALAGAAVRGAFATLPAPHGRGADSDAFGNLRDSQASSFQSVDRFHGPKRNTPSRLMQLSVTVYFLREPYAGVSRYDP